MADGDLTFWKWRHLSEIAEKSIFFIKRIAMGLTMNQGGLCLKKKKNNKNKWKYAWKDFRPKYYSKDGWPSLHHTWTFKLNLCFYSPPPQARFPPITHTQTSTVTHLVAKVRPNLWGQSSNLTGWQQLFMSQYKWSWLCQNLSKGDKSRQCERAKKELWIKEKKARVIDQWQKCWA